MGRLDNIFSGGRVCTGTQYSGIGTCVKDNLAFRMSAGISVQLEIALRPGPDRPWPALSSKPSYDRAPDHPLQRLPQDTKMTMKPIAPSLAGFAACFFPAPPFMARRPRRSPRSSFWITVPPSCNISKVGQDIAKQMQSYMTNQAKADLSGQGKAIQAEGRTLQQQVAILAPDVKAKRVAAFQAKANSRCRVLAQKKDEQLKAAFYQARQAMEQALGPILQHVIKERGANMVLDKQAVVIATSNSFDITAEVINQAEPEAAQLQDQPERAAAAAGGPAPEIEMADPRFFKNIWAVHAGADLRKSRDRPSRRAPMAIG